MVKYSFFYFTIIFIFVKFIAYVLFGVARKKASNSNIKREKENLFKEQKFSSTTMPHTHVDDAIQQQQSNDEKRFIA